MIRSTALAVIVAATLAVTLASYWFERSRAVTLRGQYMRVHAERPVPFLINGLLLDIDQVHGLDLVTAVTSSSVSAATVVFASSDRCRFTVAALPGLMKWADALSPATAPSIVLVTFDGIETPTRLAAHFRSRGLGYRIFRIRDIETVEMVTGINSTPTTFVLDGSRRVRFVAAGLKNDAAIAMMHDAVRQAGGT